ncbi:hypothetical protein AYI69_g8760, partial [Smittium culicis]
METTNNSIHKEQSPTWANVVSSRVKPPGSSKTFGNKFVPVSLFKATTGNDHIQRKIACLGGTSLKLALSIREIDQNIDEVVENILTQFGDIQTCFEIDNRRKVLFLKFISGIDLENAKKVNITYNGKKIEILETTEYSEEFKNIVIPSYNGLSVWEVAEKAYDELSKIGEVIDITALKYKNINAFPSKSIKINFKTKNDNHIPSSLEIMG